MRIFIITGLSGAGKSVALKTLEDLGCEAVDNVPLSLIPSMVDSREDRDHCLAIGEDVRSRDFSFAHVQEVIQILRNQGHQAEILFLDCDDRVLQLRFTATRRKHPLALDRPVEDGIRHERELLARVHDMADFILDTTDLTTADLKNTIRDYYGHEERALSIFLTSFSFRRGIPRDADMLFDVRFLRNPFYDDRLREKDGRDPDVAAYIAADPDEAGFFTHLTDLLLPLLPRYRQEGKSYLTIAIGCTGGKHRSVYLLEKLAGFLQKREYKVSVRHRDVESDRKGTA